MKRLFYITITLLCFSACEKNTDFGPQCIICPSDSIINDSLEQVEHKVFIINEGNFNWGNGSLSVYSPADSLNENEVFQKVNGITLGDVPQSINFNGDTAFVIVNNSDKIIAIDANSFISLGEISGLNTPRYLIHNGDIGYITSLFGNEIYKIDIRNFQLINTIQHNGWSEKGVILEEHFYFTNMDSEMFYKMNISNDVIIDSLSLASDPNSIVVDKNNKLWVLSSGGINEAIPRLYRINPNSFQIESELTFSDNSQSPEDLAINGTGDILFYLNGDVYSQDIISSSLDNNSVIGSNGLNFYGLGFDKYLNEIYVSDAGDYVQQGTVFRADINGDFIDTVTAGIIPGDFGFYVK